MSNQIAVTVSQIEASKDHVFCVEFDGEFYRAVYPEPLSELSCSFERENDAWYQLVLHRVEQLYGHTWEIEDPKKAFSLLWGILGDIPVNEDDELEDSFLHFAVGTDRLDVHHWFEEYFDLSVAQMI